MTEKQIVAYIHCRHCVEERKAQKLAAGFTADNRLQIWCEVHDCHVAMVPLAINIRDSICYVCGQPFDGREHKHGSQ